MDNKAVTLGLVVAVAILLGVGIVVKQSRDPMMKELITQQGKVLESQAKLEAKLSSAPAAGSGNSLQVQALEKRVEMLEKQVKSLIDILKGAQGGQQPPQEDFTKAYEIPVDHSPVRGNPKAPITIVAFDDIQCPFCSRFHGPILDVLKAYPDKVNLMIKFFPLSFHPQAKPATKAILAAGEQGKYWEMADALLLDNKDLSEDRFKQEAQKLGLNVDKFLKDYKDKDKQWEEIIEKDITLGGNIDVRGTPTFYINGRKTMARDLNAYKQEIDKILNETK